MHTHAAHCAWSVRRRSDFVRVRFAAGPRVPVRPGAGSPRYRPSQIDGGVGVAGMSALGRPGMSLALPCARPQARRRRRNAVGWTGIAGPAGRTVPAATSRWCLRPGTATGSNRTESELRGLTRQASSSGQGAAGPRSMHRWPLGRRPATSPRRALTGSSAPRTPACASKIAPRNGNRMKHPLMLRFEFSQSQAPAGYGKHR